MKVRAAIALAFLTSFLYGEPVVQVTGIEGRAGDTPAIHLVGGQATQFALQISSSIPGRGSISASLYQLASGLAAPIAKELPVADGFALDGPSIRLQKFTMTPPDVRAATTMELRFAVKMEAGDKWQPAGTARLVVHPADLLTKIRTQLSAATSRAGVKLTVLGESAQLKRVLREAGLIFDEAEAASDMERLYLSECSADAARALIEQTAPAVRLLIFTRDPALPPGVYWTTRGTGFTAKNTLPVLADFDHAPDRQTLFLTLFQQALRAFPNSP